jgi:hypothetical protein
MFVVTVNHYWQMTASIVIFLSWTASAHWNVVSQPALNRFLEGKWFEHSNTFILFHFDKMLQSLNALFCLYFFHFVCLFLFFFYCGHIFYIQRLNVTVVMGNTEVDIYCKRCLWKYSQVLRELTEVCSYLFGMKASSSLIMSL